MKIPDHTTDHTIEPSSGQMNTYNYIAFSGAGGIGKTSAINALTQELSLQYPGLRTTGDIQPPPPGANALETVMSIVRFKIERDRFIRTALQDGLLVIADRSCYDPLALARTVLSREDLEHVEEAYRAYEFVPGHHFLLTASRELIAARRKLRGSNPIPRLSRLTNVTIEEYEILCDMNWRHLHQERFVPFTEVDYSSVDFKDNFSRLLDAVLAQTTEFKSKGCP